jgi:hypothetical protein
MTPEVSGTPQQKNTDAAVRELLRDVLHKVRNPQKVKNPKNRTQIAAELSRAVGSPVRVYMLDEYTADSRGECAVNSREVGSRGKRRFPAAWVPAFCKITGDDRLQRLLLGEPLCCLLELGESALNAVQKKCGGAIAAADAASRSKGSR